MKIWALMSDEGTTSCACDAGYGRTVVGSRCGTVVQPFSDEEEAKKALHDIEEASKKQHEVYDVWARRSHSEPYTAEMMKAAEEETKDEKNKYVRAGARMVSATKARNKWMEMNPIPPTSLFQRFWLIELSVD
jgi:hypothetical protein